MVLRRAQMRRWDLPGVIPSPDGLFLITVFNACHVLFPHCGGAHCQSWYRVNFYRRPRSL
jgi:hypothetical protein